MSSVERYSYSRSVSSTQQQGVEMTNGGQLRVGDNGRTMVAATGGRHQTRLAQQTYQTAPVATRHWSYTMPLQQVKQQCRDTSRISRSVGGKKDSPTKHRKRETLPDIARRIPVDALRPFFKLSLVAAAEAMGISPTTLKRLCRQYGITRWPYRQISGIDRTVVRLEAELAASGGESGDALGPIIHELNLHREGMVELALEGGHEPVRARLASVGAFVHSIQGSREARSSRTPSPSRSPGSVSDAPVSSVPAILPSVQLEKRRTTTATASQSQLQPQQHQHQQKHEQHQQQSQQLDIQVQEKLRQLVRHRQQQQQHQQHQHILQHQHQQRSPLRMPRPAGLGEDSSLPSVPTYLRNRSCLIKSDEYWEVPSPAPMLDFQGGAPTGWAEPISPAAPLAPPVNETRMGAAGGGGTGAIDRPRVRSFDPSFVDDDAIAPQSILSRRKRDVYEENGNVDFPSSSCGRSTSTIIAPAAPSRCLKPTEYGTNVPPPWSPSTAVGGGKRAADESYLALDQEEYYGPGVCDTPPMKGVRGGRQPSSSSSPLPLLSFIDTSFFEQEGQEATEYVGMMEGGDNGTSNLTYKDFHQLEEPEFGLADFSLAWSPPPPRQAPVPATASASTATAGGGAAHVDTELSTWRGLMVEKVYPPVLHMREAGVGGGICF